MFIIYPEKTVHRLPVFYPVYLVTDSNWNVRTVFVKRQDHGICPGVIGIIDMQPYVSPAEFISMHEHLMILAKVSGEKGLYSDQPNRRKDPIVYLMLNLWPLIANALPSAAPMELRKFASVSG